MNVHGLMTFLLALISIIWRYIVLCFVESWNSFGSHHGTFKKGDQTFFNPKFNSCIPMLQYIYFFLSELYNLFFFNVHFPHLMCKNEGCTLSLTQSRGSLRMCCEFNTAVKCISTSIGTLWRIFDI